jgi:hypothetical protein
MPERTRVASCRVDSATCVAGSASREIAWVAPDGRSDSSAPASSMIVGVRPSARSWSRSDRWLSASISPRRALPAGSTASNR